MAVQLAVRTKRMKFNIQYLKSSTVGPSVIKTAYIDYLLDFFSGGGESGACIFKTKFARLLIVMLYGRRNKMD